MEVLSFMRSFYKVFRFNAIQFQWTFLVLLEKNLNPLLYRQYPTNVTDLYIYSSCEYTRSLALIC